MVGTWEQRSVGDLGRDVIANWYMTNERAGWIGQRRDRGLVRWMTWPDLAISSDHFSSLLSWYPLPVKLFTFLSTRTLTCSCWKLFDVMMVGYWFSSNKCCWFVFQLGYSISYAIRSFVAAEDRPEDQERVDNITLWTIFRPYLMIYKSQSQRSPWIKRHIEEPHLRR